MFSNLEGTFKPGHPNSLQRPVQEVNLQQAQGCLPNARAQRFNALMVSLKKEKGKKVQEVNPTQLSLESFKAPGKRTRSLRPPVQVTIDATAMAKAK